MQGKEEVAGFASGACGWRCLEDTYVGMSKGKATYPGALAGLPKVVDARTVGKALGKAGSGGWKRNQMPEFLEMLTLKG